MKVTAGIVITDGKRILLGHSTGNDHWDIPKGIAEKEEAYIDAAIRECQEEFGLHIHKDQLNDLGVFPLNHFKEIALFKYTVDPLPDPESCHCTTHFEDSQGNQRPEIDAYKIFPVEIGILKLSKSMRKTFEEYHIMDEYYSA